MTRHKLKLKRKKRVVNNVTAESVIKSNVKDILKKNYNAVPNRRRSKKIDKNSGNDLNFITEIFGKCKSLENTKHKDQLFQNISEEAETWGGMVTGEYTMECKNTPQYIDKHEKHDPLMKYNDSVNTRHCLKTEQHDITRSKTYLKERNKTFSQLARDNNSNKNVGAVAEPCSRRHKKLQEFKKRLTEKNIGRQSNHSDILLLNKKNIQFGEVVDRPPLNLAHYTAKFKKSTPLSSLPMSSIMKMAGIISDDGEVGDVRRAYETLKSKRLLAYSKSPNPSERSVTFPYSELYNPDGTQKWVWKK